ncbi:MAG: hypothetical protein ABJB95_09980, partial [Gemmatimonadales bacterium]
MSALILAVFLTSLRRYGRTMSLFFGKVARLDRAGIAACILAAACNVQTFGSEPEGGSSNIIWTAVGAVSGQPATDGTRIYYG